MHQGTVYEHTAAAVPGVDAEEVTELRTRLAGADDPREVYREIPDNVCGAAMELHSP